MLLRGTEEDRLRWIFRLYDTNGEGYISKEEMEDVAQSVRMDLCLFCLMLVFKVFDLMGKEDDEDCHNMSALVVDQRVGVVFQVIQTSGYRGRIHILSGNGYKQ